MSQHAPDARNGTSAAVFRFAADTFAGLALFLSIMLFSAGDAAVGAALESGHRFVAGTGLSGTTGAHSAPVLLAGVFSMLVAFNLAFFRHLHGTYATPRHRTKRN